MHSLTHSLSHSLTLSLSHSLTHSLTGTGDFLLTLQSSQPPGLISPLPISQCCRAPCLHRATGPHRAPLTPSRRHRSDPDPRPARASSATRQGANHSGRSADSYEPHDDTLQKAGAITLSDRVIHACRDLRPCCT